MATYPVKYFHSGMAGAPQLSDAHGVLTTMLDAVLVNGFNSLNPTTISRSGSVATATYATAHGYLQDQIIKVSGCNETEYNGEQRVVSVPTSTTLTFAVTGLPATLATGTPNTITAPLTFEITYSATNIRIYRSTNSSSTKPQLRVDNSLDAGWTGTYAKFARVGVAPAFKPDGFTPTGIDYIPFSTSITNSLAANQTIQSGSGATAQLGWHKWYYARADASNNSESTTPSSGNRSWTIVGDDRGFYFFTEFNFSYGKAGYAFTEFPSFRTNDIYNTFFQATDLQIAANSGTWSYSSIGGPNPYSNFCLSNDTSGKWIMRDVTSTVPCKGVLNTFQGLATQETPGYATGMAYPDPVTGGANFFPVTLQDSGGGSSGSIRGMMPGLFWIMNNNSPFNNRDTVINVAGYAGRTFFIVSLGWLQNGNVIRIAFDITGDPSNNFKWW
jgi:hypothetical protein